MVLWLCPHSPLHPKLLDYSSSDCSLEGNGSVHSLEGPLALGLHPHPPLHQKLLPPPPCHWSLDYSSSDRLLEGYCSDCLMEGQTVTAVLWHEVD